MVAPFFDEMVPGTSRFLLNGGGGGACYYPNSEKLS